MSELAKRESAPIFTDGWDDTAAEAEARIIRGSLLKFSEGRWTIGTENEAVKEGRQLVAVANAAAWVKWKGGKPVEYRVREPGAPLPEREVLGDCDRLGERLRWPAARSVAEHSLRALDRSANR